MSLSEMKNEFCREVTLKLNEPLAGSAPYTLYYIYVSWPKKLWGSRAMDSESLPPSIPEWLAHQNATRGKTILRLASRPECTTNKTNIFIYPGGHHYAHVPPHKVAAVLEDHFSGSPNPTYVQPPRTTPQIFICTHGRYDKCCAKFGQNVFQKFREEIGQRRLPFDLWESSHLGGHRFSSTGLIFPLWHMYGRMTPDQVPTILDCLLKYQVYAPAYRGCFELEPIAQTIEACAQQYAYEQGGAYQAEFLQTDSPNPSHVRAQVRLNPRQGNPGGTHELTIHLVAKTFDGPLSCTDLENPKNPPRTRWVLDKIEV